MSSSHRWVTASRGRLRKRKTAPRSFRKPKRYNLVCHSTRRRQNCQLACASIKYRQMTMQLNYRTATLVASIGQPSQDIPRWFPRLPVTKWRIQRHSPKLPAQLWSILIFALPQLWAARAKAAPTDQPPCSIKTRKPQFNFRSSATNPIKTWPTSSFQSQKKTTRASLRYCFQIRIADLLTVVWARQRWANDLFWTANSKSICICKNIQPRNSIARFLGSMWLGTTTEKSSSNQK